LRDFEGHRRAGEVIHVPQVSAHGQRHGYAVPFVIRRARGITVRQAWQVVPDHLLIVLKTPAGQDHRFAGLDVAWFAVLFRPDTEDVFRHTVLDELFTGSLIQNL